MAGGTVIAAAVEGIVDEAVVRKLIAHADATPGDVYGRQGKSFLRQRIAGYNNAAQRMPWIVLVDLDLDNDCAPPLRMAAAAGAVSVLSGRGARGRGMAPGRRGASCELP